MPEVHWQAHYKPGVSLRPGMYQLHVRHGIAAHQRLALLLSGPAALDCKRAESS
jgi:hypothetical protein